jgi:RNA-directed DNA polymerase
MTEPRKREIQLPLVPHWAKQGREVDARWAWTEPTVWTERMLATLVKGVKGGKWFSLIDKVFSKKNLLSSWTKVQRNKGSQGVDGQTIEQFSKCADHYLDQLHNRLVEGTYRPDAVRRHWITKEGTSKQRPLGIPVIRDRVVQGALRHVLEPLWEAKFVEHSYGFRPGRSCKDALRRVSELLKSGHTWVVDADIQSYFDTIPKDQLMGEVEKVVADSRVLDLLRMFLNQSVMEGLKEWKPDKGTPQGAVISPLLANIYLHPIDLAISAGGFEMVRYADDLVIMCRSEEEAQRALALLRQQMDLLQLTLHPDKTKLVNACVKGGFDFLGYHFERGMRWPRKKSMDKLKDRVRALTKRTAGKSLMAIVEALNPVLRGWFEYFKHSHYNVLEGLDGWIRRRLRSNQRKQIRLYGLAKIHGEDQRRWPNVFFQDCGLFSLKEAQKPLRMSLRGKH